MTREDIIRMAHEAGATDKMGVLQFYRIELEAFAALVAAAERDRMCQQFNIPKELAHEKATGNEAD